MTERELFEKNLEISSEFSRYIVAHPEVGDNLPTDKEIVFLVDSDPELSKSNLELAKKIKKEGSGVVFIHIKTLLPKETSRLVEPRIETTAK